MNQNPRNLRVNWRQTLSGIGSGALASFGRSRELVCGRGWHVFATLVLVYVILLVVNGVLDVIFRALPHVLGTGLATVISGTVISPFLALVVTLVLLPALRHAHRWRRALRRRPAVAAGHHASPAGPAAAGLRVSRVQLVEQNAGALYVVDVELRAELGLDRITGPSGNEPPEYAVLSQAT